MKGLATAGARLVAMGARQMLFFFSIFFPFFFLTWGIFCFLFENETKRRGGSVANSIFREFFAPHMCGIWDFA